MYPTVQLLIKNKEREEHSLMQAEEMWGRLHARTCMWLWKCSCCSVEVTPHRATPQPRPRRGNNCSAEYSAVLHAQALKGETCATIARDLFNHLGYQIQWTEMKTASPGFHLDPTKFMLPYFHNWRKNPAQDAFKALCKGAITGLNHAWNADATWQQKHEKLY